MKTTTIKEYYQYQSKQWADLAYQIACEDGGLERYAYAMKRSRDFEKLAKLDGK